MRRNVNISAPNLMNICIDRFVGHNYNGRIYHKLQQTPCPFEDIGKMLKLIDFVCDISGYPQSTTQKRLFKEQCEEISGEGAVQMADIDNVLGQKGELATFIVHIKYRQHSTWQGEIVWAEKNKKQTFRSALELLKLIDNALEDDECSELRE